MSPEFMFTVEVAKELLIIMHSDKQLNQTSCLVMNGWSSNWTELSLHPVWVHILFMPLTCKSLAVEACLWCPYNSKQFSTQFFHCCVSCIATKRNLKKGNSMGKNVWFKTLSVRGQMLLSPTKTGKPKLRRHTANHLAVARNEMDAWK